MPHIEVPDYKQTFAADGTAAGSIQVADSSGFYVGCGAYLLATARGNRCCVVSIPDATHVVVRIVAEDNEGQLPVQFYGAGSNLLAAGYTVANGAVLSMPRQLASVEPAWVKTNARNI